jgi:ribosomal protein L28
MVFICNFSTQEARVFKANLVYAVRPSQENGKVIQVDVSNKALLSQSKMTVLVP